MLIDVWYAINAATWLGSPFSCLFSLMKLCLPHPQSTTKDNTHTHTHTISYLSLSLSGGSQGEPHLELLLLLLLLLQCGPKVAKMTKSPNEFGCICSL